MKEILNANLEVKVFKYESEKELNKHKDKMLKDGWKCTRSGQYNLSPVSTITAFCNEKNWYYVAEFNKKNEFININKPTSYESEAYWFTIYEPED
ncbi:hypothetical protein [Clostridium botulinum]|uniref:Uncharacterized protein n=1 Tax=Clostridium botulinum (strain Langeland / NCTC 10281 / Type F) TaxID=441772 RepID=A7GFW3_CLOBL|nr:hypothetical protein [Clostridium botulinum]ABS39417.1 hypothetical protein CLI_2431 [Clostridium botulinum F str. Langeland]ADG00082.1 hypothetical protein CBF_2421 [Clostridium botulinum F str. 230613]KKM42369.1 hypothetical protein VT72_01635 [Clostridium botulinum]MBY6793152.1 hypothetical protein [Clostridium botulinum]MBY6937362.1 hypothetical protein [Clostridium botulinum]